MLEYTPKVWKEAKLIFIPKPGKSSYKVAKSRRPISLTNYLIKALEKPDGTLTEPGQPTLDFLMQAHFPSGSKITETPYDYTKSVTLQEVQSTDIEWITTDLIKTCLLYTSPSPRD